MDSNTELECEKLIAKYKSYEKGDWELDGKQMETPLRVKARNDLYGLMHKDLIVWIKSILGEWGKNETEEEILSMSWQTYIYCLEKYDVDKKAAIPYYFSRLTKYWLLNNYAEDDHIMLPLDEVQETLLVDEDNKAALSFSRLLWVNDIGDKIPDEYKVVWEDALLSMHPQPKSRKVTYSHGLTSDVYFAIKKCFKVIIRQILEIE